MKWSAGLLVTQRTCTPPPTPQPCPKGKTVRLWVEEPAQPRAAQPPWNPHSGFMKQQAGHKWLNLVVFLFLSSHKYRQRTENESFPSYSQAGFIFSFDSGLGLLAHRQQSAGSQDFCLDQSGGCLSITVTRLCAAVTIEGGPRQTHMGIQCWPQGPPRESFQGGKCTQGGGMSALGRREGGEGR